jgi:hypothetical protein
MTNRPIRPAFLLGLLAVFGTHAEAAIYRCNDGHGHLEYTDTAKAGCKALDLPDALPSPSRRGAPLPAAGAMAPKDFPRVDNAQQKARDSERRQILEDELHSEEKKLADLKKDFNNGEPERQGNERNYAKYQERVDSMREGIARTERNIEALKRELASVK